MHDEVPVTAEPGFYKPGRSPSLLLALALAAPRHPGVAPWEAMRHTEVRRNGRRDGIRCWN